MPGGGGVCSLANNTVAYEETQSNRVTDFRNFVYSLFPTVILLDFIILKLTLPDFERTINSRVTGCREADGVPLRIRS